MTNMVQVALAEDVTEAEEIQAILTAAGIDSALETAIEHHPRENEDAPQKVWSPSRPSRPRATRSRRSPSRTSSIADE